MSSIHVGVGSLNQTPLDWEGNQRRILSAITQARAADISLLCLPELCIPGYGCEDAFFSAATQRLSLEVLEVVAAETKAMIVCLGLPLVVEGHLYNAAAVLADGAIIGITLKRALPKDGIHYEPRWFRPWSKGRVTQIEVCGQQGPAGDLLYNCGGMRLGVEICEDAWIADRPAASLAAAGVDVILNPSASHFAFGKREIRENIVLESSRAFHCVYLYANALGNEAGRILYDGDSLIASNAQLAARSTRFSFAEVQLSSAVVDLQHNRGRVTQSAHLAEDGTSAQRGYHQAVHGTFQLPRNSKRVVPSKPAQWEQDAHRKEQEFTRAVALALFDYLRKSRSKGFVISLSGGADSSGTACLVHICIALAYAELGKEQFLQRLSYIPELAAAVEESDQAEVVAALCRQLLTCVYQATENSSETTRDAAQSVAEALGAQYHEISIQHIVDSYVSKLQEETAQSITWQTHDMVLQNIQARVRGPFVWMIANDKQALLLATSNRSEAAVGYTTMDGDTCGGLSPIGGIDKAFLLTWLRWLAGSVVGFDAVAVLGKPDSALPAALQKVIGQSPTAELRPPAAMQSDERDLMPYVVLDKIERLAIRDRRSPAQVLAEIQDDFPEESASQLCVWVSRFFRLWSVNQWKRERYAPSFHLDDENLDPKTWCRFPILSGGFERELAELREKCREA